MLETVLVTLLTTLVEHLKNRIFIGFSAHFYLVNYYVSYLVRLLVSSMLDQFVNARKVAYLRGLSDIVTLLICLLSPLLIVNKKSPANNRGFPFILLRDIPCALSCFCQVRKNKVFRFPEEFR